MQLWHTLLDANATRACRLSLHHAALKVTREGAHNDMLRLPIDTICARSFASFLYGLCELFQNIFSIIPMDAGIGDADAIFKARFAFSGHFLATCKSLSPASATQSSSQYVPSLIWLSIMTPIIADSPPAICSARECATFGWFL